MTRPAVTFLLILTILNVIATISLWQTWLDVMGTNWAFRTFFASEVRGDIGMEIAASVLGGLLPAGLAFLASAREWHRRHLVHMACALWLIAYLLVRVPPLQTMWKAPIFDLSFGLGMWFRFHGFPAGTLAPAILLLAVSATSLLRERGSSPLP
ncbi:MAG: hypothetical protein EAZ40_01560 [Rhodobacterales bacterium]|nr:MAG: hypothetical protein EAZ40_01560 [Rhodobacterales bacterium]